LSQINESATVPKTFHFSELNKTKASVDRKNRGGKIATDHAFGLQAEWVVVMNSVEEFSLTTILEGEKKLCEI